MAGEGVEVGGAEGGVGGGWGRGCLAGPLLGEGDAEFLVALLVEAEFIEFAEEDVEVREVVVALGDLEEGLLRRLLHRQLRLLAVVAHPRQHEAPIFLHAPIINR